ncbi:BlaI/MecI/CopY family transcriptional regulator [Janthinobacterium sp. SUN033]|uniref:BlaI/MecI/CopY family transcriptional regulator n=1 Tax=Janthinobacterium sp. SUN033 TaxID=3002439 RepID=UPI0025B25B6A|nr:BlaI/MecI/CopY family transcriptional regulator [Janthinobacterium sp. SUN033]MDN2678359.1 BlaI/MecI/CopY family transcriptional regulator [Janthinobacterium sp. SUN033]
MSTPSVTELSLLKALWKEQPLSARELHARVEEELGWSFSSTRKTVERMLDKGMLLQRSVHGVLVYEANADKVATLAAFAHDFGRRVMEIDSPLPVSMFTGSKLVDRQELAALEQLLHDWPLDGKE